MRPTVWSVWEIWQQNYLCYLCTDKSRQLNAAVYCRGNKGFHRLTAALKYSIHVLNRVVMATSNLSEMLTSWQHVHIATSQCAEIRELWVVLARAWRDECVFNNIVQYDLLFSLIYRFLLLPLLSSYARQFFYINWLCWQWAHSLMLTLTTYNVSLSSWVALSSEL